MNRLIHIPAIAVTAALLVPFMWGCQPTHTASDLTNHGQRAGAKLADISSDIIAAKTHADSYGKAMLDSASVTLASVLKEDMPALEAAGGLLEKEQKAHAADLARDKWIGWKTRAILTTILIIFIVLFVIHFGSIGLSIFFQFSNPPLALVFGNIARIVNPPAWGLWVLSHFERQSAATQAAVTGTVPGVTPKQQASLVAKMLKARGGGAKMPVTARTIATNVTTFTPPGTIGSPISFDAGNGP